MSCNHEALFKNIEGKCYVCINERPYKIMQELFQVLGMLKKLPTENKTCGFCAKPCGNNWCPTKGDK